MKTLMTSLGVILLVVMGCDVPAEQDQQAAAPADGPVDATDQPGASASDDAPAIVRSNNAFAFALYAKLAEEADGNLFFSPASIHTALTMTYAGARGNTARQMADVLALPHDIFFRPPMRGAGDMMPIPWEQDRVHPAYRGLLAQLTPGPDAGYQLHVANALWGQEGYAWLDEFLQVTEDNYGAGLQEVDFVSQTEQARQTINTWVEEQTNDKIRELLKRGILTPETALVLTNAIYFKGDWASQFDPDATADAPFHISADESVDAPLMHQEGTFGYAEDENVQIISLPYVGDELSMVVILPKQVDGLANAAGQLTPDALSGMIAGLQEREVDVYLPKFTMTSEFSLGEVLQSMGMTDAFGNADFSGMNGGRDLFISAVVHKAFVDVNEEGTEAAAATGVVMGITSVPPAPPVFRADHPFLFVIRHNETGAILFMGRVTDPTAE